MDADNYWDRKTKIRGHRWKNADNGKLTYSKEILSHCHFIHHETYMDWPGIEPGTPW